VEHFCELPEDLVEQVTASGSRPPP
jgi:hypothetical protein